MTNEEKAVATTETRSITARMAERFEMDVAAFQQTLSATIMNGKGTREQHAAFLLVSHEYNLNPFTKEIYAFPNRGGIVPIVSVDGWHKIANNHPQYDGHEIDVVHDDELGVGIKTIIHRKDRGHPTTHVEWMNECKGATDPWKRWPMRMLGHKSFIQCARKAFSLAGIYDPDEGERIRSVDAEVTKPAKPARGVAALTERVNDEPVVVEMEPAVEPEPDEPFDADAAFDAIDQADENTEVEG